MFEIGVVSEFEAAHKLEGDFGLSSNLHGHTYRVELTLQGKELDTKGILYDLGELKEYFKNVLEKLHCQYLNKIFKGDNPTAENVSKYISNCIFPLIKNKSLAKLKVKVWESSSAFASYERDFT